MSTARSLLGGRNQKPLTVEEVKRVTWAFASLDAGVNARYDPEGPTRFHVAKDEFGNDFGEIVFGRDIYPGGSVVDPNAGLSLLAAAAHELTHYYRWLDKTYLDAPSAGHLDEALTSLEAISRYERHLAPLDTRLLAADAILRIRIYVEGLSSTQGAGVSGG